MKQIFAYFVGNPKLTITLSLIAILGGVMGLQNLNRESRPPVDFASVTISTFYPGASPEEVEEQVTNKIEEEIRTVEGIKDTVSVSKSSESTITVRIEMDEYNTTRVADDIQRAVQKVSLPAIILDDPVVTRANAKEIPIFDVALSGSNQNRTRDQLADDLKDVMEDVDGVSKVSFRGYQDRAYYIYLDAKKMNQLQVGVDEVLRAVQSRNRNTPAGYVEQGTQKQLIRIQGRVRSIEDTMNIVVRSNFSGRSIQVKDIAEAVDGMEEARLLAKLNGVPATLISVTKTAGSDSITTVENLRKALKNFEEKRLPEGYKLTVYSDEAEQVAFRLNIVTNNAISGLILVLISLLIFLPGWAGVLAGLSMPITVFATLGLMPIVGANFNNITMLALVIVLGMIVDNSIVISENYSRHRFEGLGTKDAALKAAHEFWMPITATALTTIAAFLPMLVTKGIMGQFIRWIPIIVSIALAISLIESFILLPGRLQFTIKGKPGVPLDEKQSWFDPFIRFFEKLILKAIKLRYLTVFAIICLLAFSGFVTKKFNRFQLFPRDSVETYIARYSVERGTRIDETSRIAEFLEPAILEKLGQENVEHMVHSVGRSSTGNRDPLSRTADHVGMVQIKIPKEIAETLDPRDVLKNFRTIDKGPLETLTFESIVGGPPVGKPLNVVFRSRSDEQLQSFVKEVMAEVKTIEGVFEVETDQFSASEEYAIKLDYNTLARLNLTAEGVGRVLRAAFQGSPVSELYLDGDDFYLNVRYRDQDRSSLASLENTRVTDSRGYHIPLKNFAKIEKIEGPFDQKHYNYNRAITLTADVDEEVITSVDLNTKVREITASKAENYPRVSLTFGGEQESTRESLSSLKSAMGIAVLVIFAILVFLYGSFIRPMMILSTLVLGFVGVSLAFAVHEKPLSFFAMIGVVGLAGVVINASIVLTSFLDDRCKDVSDEDWQKEVAKSTSMRLRAITVTTLTTAAGLMPTAYGLGGSDNILMPMTLSLAWGLVSGTFLALFWIPCLYVIMNDFTMKFMKKRF